jgi:hypothetical protein
MLGYWLYLVAPLVPLKAVIFADNKQQQEQQQQQEPQAPAQAPVNPSTKQQHVQQQGGVLSGAPAAQQQQQQTGLSSDAKGAALAATGCLAGFASGMLGIGGGTGELHTHTTCSFWAVAAAYRP